MKIKLYIAVVAAFILSACQALNFDNIVGQPVRFRATMADNGLTTRTIYSGEGGWSDGLFKERINWTTGDDVIVYMDWEQVSGVSAIPDPDANHYYYYNVSPTDNGNPEYIHHGTLSAKQAGKSLTWKGDKDKNVIFNHYFYSVYPATCAAGGSAGINYKNPNDVSFTFTLPYNNVDNMRYAYMAAVAEAVQTNHTGKDGQSPYEKAIDLDYYPMITTLYVTLVNNSSKKETIEVYIATSASSLFGTYTVGYDNGTFNLKEETIIQGGTTSSHVPYDFSSDKKISKPFFVIPRLYSNKQITLFIDGYKYELDYEFKPFHKYNITVNLNDPSSKPEPPTIDDLSQGGAQLLALLIKHKLSENTTRELLGGWGGDHDAFKKAIWDKLETLITNNGGEFTNISLDDLIEIFGSKDALNKLLKYLQEEWSGRYNVEISESPKISSDVSAEDLQLLFPNATRLKFQVAQDGIPADRKRPITINVSGLPKLITAEFQYAEAINVDQCSSLEKITAPNGDKLQLLYVNDCENLTTISIETPKALTQFSLIDTPNFEGATIDGVEKTVTVYLEDCSTNKKNVELVFHGNGNVQMDKKIRSDNVTVIRRDYGGNESRY